MQREIYEIIAKIVDANGTYSTLDGYPKVISSRTYEGDLLKTRNRAYSAWHEVLGAMYKREDRQLQLAMILRVSDGYILERATIGAFVPDPDPEPEPPEEDPVDPEPEPEPEIKPDTEEVP